MVGAAGSEWLLERETELARALDLVREAQAGRGRVLVVEGPAGIGKTALLAAISRRAEAAGLLALQARGGELESEFPLGVVRQLFEPHLRALDAERREQVLSGAAELASPVLAPAGPIEPRATDTFGVIHGLYWVTANLAEGRPLALVIDDAQWSDAGSLRYLLHLARRLDGVAVLVVLALRTGEANDELLSRIAAEPEAEVVVPAPLTDTSVARAIAEYLGDEPHARFTAACRRATGGTPFLVHALLSALAEEGVRPSSEAAQEVHEIGPQAVARVTLARLSRLSPGATRLARAVAVLGGHGRLDHAARLAGIDLGEAAQAADALAAMGVLTRARPLDFVHPIVRSAIYEDLPPAARAAAHARAAELLAAEAAEADAVAGHLLQTEPAGRAETVARLRAAAAHALARGAPESAAAYLRRALAEGGLDDEGRAVLLHELGAAERPLGSAQAIELLGEALALASDAGRRGRIAHDLADTLFYVERWEEATAVVESAIADVEASDPELAVRLHALRMLQAFTDARQLDVLARLPEMRAYAGPETPARRVMSLLLAALGASLGEPVQEVRRLIDVGLTDDGVLVEEEPESWVMSCLYQALALIDDLDRGVRCASAVADRALRRGSSYGHAYNLAYRGWIHARRGDLAAAEADIRVALPAIREHGVRLGEIGAPFFFVDALLERPDLEDEAQRVLALDVPPELETTVYRPLLLETRGRLRLARGDVGGSVRDLQECSETVYAHTSPSGWGWRPALALALGSTDRDRALELAHQDLEVARQVGLPRPHGVALRTLGLLAGGDAGFAHLEDAVEVLARSPSRLEQARGHVELGAALRRANRRADAREPLRLGLDLAVGCGAVRLAQRARTELVATGARPRRDVLTGRDALTATEHRIAALASQGLSNREIAQALFVTRKTVEGHLGRVYAKLGINSRERLRESLSPADPG